MIREKRTNQGSVRGAINQYSICFELALFYHERLQHARERYVGCGRDLDGAFRRFQDSGRLEIITTAASHARLPLLEGHMPSLRAQILSARDH